MSGQHVPLKATMPNGAVVSDWLGTAATAARVGAMHIEDVRKSQATNPLNRLIHAEGELMQALTELRTVKAYCAYLNTTKET